MITVPDFFQDESEEALRSQVEWQEQHLGLGDRFFARLLPQGVPGDPQPRRDLGSEQVDRVVSVRRPLRGTGERKLMPVNPALAVTIPAGVSLCRITAVSYHRPKAAHHKKVVNGMGARKSRAGARYNYGRRIRPGQPREGLAHLTKGVRCRRAIPLRTSWEDR
jgi:hypothetical protein